MKTRLPPAKRLCYLLYLLLFFLSASSTIIWAQTIIYVDVNADDEDGTSWINAYTKLQDALADATSGDQIWVAEGTYYPDKGGGQVNDARNATFQLIEGVLIYGGFPAGGGTFGDRDPDAYPTILSGDLKQDDGPNFADNAYHVLQGDSLTAATILDGFTITAGNADEPFPNNVGGGLYLIASSPTLVSCSFSDNSAVFGGGVYNVNNSSPTLTNCSFSGNSATFGGGILNNSSSPELTNCSFSGNSSNQNGGGISNSNSSPTLTNCSFSGNSSGLGGGILNATNSSPELTNCSFSGNNANFDGGGMGNFSASSPELINCSFSGNNADSEGGGIYNDNDIDTSAALTNCIIWNNRDSSGTGIGTASTFGPGFTYSYCLVKGINLTSSDGLNGVDPSNNPDFLDPVDAAVAPATGGDLRLMLGSPAIDKGHNASNMTEPLDLDGNTRIQDGIIDLGAYEARPPMTLFVDVTATAGDNDGTSWSNAFLKLQDALDEAGTGDQIWVAKGIYYPDEGSNQIDDNSFSTFDLIDGLEIYGGFPIGGGAFADRNPARHTTTLSGDLDQDDGTGGDNSGNALSVVSGTVLSSATILDGFTIQAGNANGTGGVGSQYGGGIYLASSSPIVTNCMITGNAAIDGGGISNIGNSSPTFSNCTISGNSALNGGGIYNGGSSPVLTNCTVSGNSAGVDGGGIFNDDSSPTVTNCTITGNGADIFGGGICSNNGSSSGHINCAISGNSAGSHGGGMYNGPDSFSSFTNCIIWNNAASGATTTISASVRDMNSSAYWPRYSYCLIANSGGSSSWEADLGKDNGNNIDTAPLFFDPVNPGSAPTTGGDLRLREGSLAIDVGDGTDGASVNTSVTDLGGNPRFDGTIDLGAYEGGVAIIYVDDNPSGTGDDGTSWADAYDSLKDALDEAVAGDEIWVAKGTYYPDVSGLVDPRDATFQLIEGVRIYGGFPDDGSAINGSDRDPGTYPSILSGDLAKDDGIDTAYADNAHHVLRGISLTAATILDGFTITAGNANGAVFSGAGGGLLLTSSSPTLTNCLFSGNRAKYGGGIYNYNSSSPALTNCSFSGNNAGGQADSGGGGIFNNVSSSPDLTNCSFSGNNANDDGGGILSANNSLPTFTNCTFSGNNAGGNGGGLINNTSSTATLTNCIVWNNRDTSGTGTGNSSTYGSGYTYFYCIVEGHDLTGTNGLDGTEPSNDPLFLDSVNPGSAPTTSGNLRLREGSPAIDVGDSTANTKPLDLAGNTRIQNGTIDLGAHEGGVVIIYVDNNPSGTGNDGTSWADAFTEFHNALDVAEAGNEIWVAEGIYRADVSGLPNPRYATFQLIDGVRIYGGFPDGGSAAQLSDRDLALHTTTLSGDLDESNNLSTGDAYHVLTGSSLSTATILDGFAITGGNADGGGFPINVGGGLYLSASSPTINNCTFTANNAVSGGGIFNLSSSSPDLTNCTFSNNTANDGAGMLNNLSSSPTLSGCLFSGNGASNRGGGMFNVNSSSPSLTNCTLTTNSASDDGGGMFNNSSSSPELTNCSVTGNSAGDDGGGIYNDSSSPTFTNCLFLGNRTFDGGGGVLNVDGSSTDFINCTFSGNHAETGTGGGILSVGASSTSLTNCIIWNNRANGATGTPNSSTSGTGYSYSYCLVQGLDLTSSNGQNGVDPSNNPDFLDPVDPAVAPTTDGDLRLMLGSSALGMGDGGDGSSSNTSDTDLGGNPRFDGTIDLGAYEGSFSSLLVTFAGLYPALDPNDDENNNGITNYGDYAAGGDPTAPDDPSLQTQINGTQITFSYRNNASDVFVLFQKSDDLENWFEMVEDTGTGGDYATSPGEVINGVQTLITLDLLISDPTFFFREKFSTTAP